MANEERPKANEIEALCRRADALVALCSLLVAQAGKQRAEIRRLGAGGATVQKSTLAGNDLATAFAEEHGGVKPS